MKDDNGKLALQRGPIIYCAEWADNNGHAANFIIPENAVFKPEYNASLLNGITVLKGDVKQVNIDADGQNINTENKQLVVIPYYAWANRGKGEMMVWFPSQVKNIDLLTSLGN